MAGRPREAHVKRDTRKCPKHGFTDYAATIVGTGDSLVYRCMKCDADKTQKYRDDIKAGIRVPKKRVQLIQIKKPSCPGCFTELPVTNTCEDCNYTYIPTKGLT